MFEPFQIVDGRVVVLVEPDLELVVLLERSRATLLHRRMPVPEVIDELVENLRRGLNRQTLLSASGRAPGVDTIGTPRSEVMTSTQAALALGVTDRTIRRRCVDGRYPGAARSGRDWLIPVTDLEEAA